MIIKANCKFCGKPLSLVVDDDYAALSDPYRLMGGPSCDRCADYMTRRIALHESIQEACLALYRREVPGDMMVEFRDNLGRLVRRYVRQAARHHGVSDPGAGDEVIQAIMQRPRDFAEVLKRSTAFVKVPLFNNDVRKEADDSHTEEDTRSTPGGS